MKQRLFYLTLLLSLINFFVAAFLGVLLRVQPLYPLEGLVPRYVVHAHSHVAFLGWVFLALIAFIYKYGLPETRQVAVRYAVLLVIFQVSVLGMLVTFPFTGYALWSIVFSTLHMVASLYFVFFFLKKSHSENALAKKFVTAGLFFMALSSVGPLALGPLMATGHKMDMWYNLSIYFYLHFQYNGWFTLVIIGLVLSRLPAFTVEKYRTNITRSFWGWVAGVVLTYFLSALGYRLSLGWNVVGGAGAIFQLIGFLLLFPVFLRAVKLEFQRFHRNILALVIALLAGKVLAQVLSTFPVFVDLTYYNRDFIIAYLHWVLLGFVSVFLIHAIFKEILPQETIKKKDSGILASWVFFYAFLVMEVILIFRGVFQVSLSAGVHYGLRVALLADAIVLVFSIFFIFLQLFKVVSKQIY